MTRTELTNIIGNNYLQTNCEEDEYTMPGTSKNGNTGRADRVFNDGNLWIVVETKRNSANLIGEKPQLDRYVKWVWENKNPEHVIGILYNEITDEAITFVDGELNEQTNRIVAMAVYKNMFVNAIDKNAIYRVTMAINENMNSNMGMVDLSDRMIFTACALVAYSRYNANLANRKGEGYQSVKECINTKLTHGLADDIHMNVKLALLAEKFNTIEINNTSNVDAVDVFIDQIIELASYINNRNWRGEDVMHIFFDEFNRYGGSSTLGQVFTPEHVVDLICKLMHVNINDHVLDACCGSGTFLTKAMSIMLNEAGDDEELRQKVFTENLYGIELDKRVFCLAAANMLVHKDGKTNIIQDDALSKDSENFIKRANITKVLMNPPYEDCYHCIDIVLKVMDSVPAGTQCAFILPNQKLVIRNNWRKFKNHTLTRIVKLPEETFDAGVDTSIFFFTAGRAQGTTRVQAYKLENDGLVRVRNRGRHDILNTWDSICEDFVTKVESGELEHQTGTIEEVHTYTKEAGEITLSDVDLNHILVDLFLYENGKDIIYNIGD